MLALQKCAERVNTCQSMKRDTAIVISQLPFIVLNMTKSHKLVLYCVQKKIHKKTQKLEPMIHKGLINEIMDILNGAMSSLQIPHESICKELIL